MTDVCLAASGGAVMPVRLYALLQSITAEADVVSGARATLLHIICDLVLRNVISIQQRPSGLVLQ